MGVRTEQGLCPGSQWAQEERQRRELEFAALGAFSVIRAALTVAAVPLEAWSSVFCGPL